ncbi:deoxyuridine 5'-triphosphate nucleotidohydrolase, mitochondrial isoform X3 [Panthera leo]|uniref:deoxyuridine 5'-triphosphate nucleotidohydrolase, mitochondrial isoform X3 n=1 Tax=Panthera leo TaxID=9689 RepID=UPI001C69637E|nr:deoxyuridine 5'-triphosphate nucleotidohydrolase, mitochondrial isoform X3 [Panthera leo]
MLPGRIFRVQTRRAPAGAGQPTSAQTSGQMTPVCPRPALGYHFFPCLLRSVFKDARSAAPRAEAAGPPRPLSSTRSLSRGCRGASIILSPLVPSFLSFCSAMPCSEATPTISPSKRARPAEDAMRLRFVRLSEHATAPSKGSARAAGYDLYSAYDYTVPPMEKVLVKTDIQIALPSGCYGRVAPRSGLAAKHFIDVGAGVIDEDYRGNVGVVLFNFGKEKFEVKKGDRIAQLICERIFYPEIEEVQVLDDTERGSGGFGSTGKN